jgi:hypothetical protein
MVVYDGPWWIPGSRNGVDSMHPGVRTWADTNNCIVCGDIEASGVGGRFACLDDITLEQYL